MTAKTTFNHINELGDLLGSLQPWTNVQALTINFEAAYAARLTKKYDLPRYGALIGLFMQRTGAVNIFRAPQSTHLLTEYGGSFLRNDLPRLPIDKYWTVDNAVEIALCINMDGWDVLLRYAEHFFDNLGNIFDHRCKEAADHAISIIVAERNNKLKQAGIQFGTTAGEIASLIKPFDPPAPTVAMNWEVNQDAIEKAAIVAREKKEAAHEQEVMRKRLEAIKDAEAKASMQRRIFIESNQSNELYGSW